MDRLVLVSSPECGDVRQHFVKCKEFSAVRTLHLPSKDMLFESIRKLIGELGVCNPNLVSVKVLAITNPCDKTWVNSSPVQTVRAASSVLKNCVFCFTGFGAEGTIGLRQILQFLVLALGGRISEDLSELCTHLIVDRTATGKYIAGCELKSKGMNLHITTKDWILETFLSARKKDELEFPVQALVGHRIGITGFKNEDRAEVSDLIMQNGGIFESLFSIDCTHLVAASPSGEKFKFALISDIPVVNRQWIVDMIASRGCLSQGQESKYALSSGFSGANVLELIQFANFQAANREGTEDQTEGDEDISMLDFLDNLIVVLYGFPADLEIHLRRLVLYGGGIRLSLSEGELIHSDTTHIVVPVDSSGKATVLLSQSVMAQLNRDDVPIVNANWLLESCKQAKNLAVDSFLVSF
eukprot:TRINITY_DN5555_c0_g3_i1.p1 TRINITY_DN5555_c0_g3~~TRINITY_DN5555_c0_g3_i1.p1  ORF type:complete len:412 (+),score=91.89 TRINITY_DN5555_c0_g3_i1:36-1271(+)